MKKSFAFLLILLSSFTVFSQSKEQSVHLNEIEVSAEKTNLYTGISRVVTVIDQQEIQKMPVKSIDELLDNVAGIDVRQRGVNGVQADISIRGGSFDQILILLNGINITDPQTGHYNLDIPLELSDVSRIEILQGSAARVLGPNAFSGVINIVTGERHSVTEPGKNAPETWINDSDDKEKRRNLTEKTSDYSITSQHAVGSYGYLSQSISGNYGDKKWSVFGSAVTKKSDGYIDNTDFDISNIYLQSRINAGNAGIIEVQTAVQLKSFGSNGFYSLVYPNQFEHTKTFLASISWNRQIGAVYLSAQGYWREHHDRFELFRDMEGAEKFTWYTGHNFHLTDITGGKITGSSVWAIGKTTLGVDIRNEHIFSNVLGVKMETPKPVPFEKNKKYTFEDNRLITNIFLDHLIRMDKWTFSGGAALSHAKQFDTHVNGGADIHYSLSKDIRIYASANSAVRLPTFTDLYYKGAQQIANPNLRPEKSQTYELGSKINSGNLTASASVYYRLGRDVIDWVKRDSTDKKYVSLNLTSVNALGTDLNAQYRLKNGFIRSVTLTYSYLHLYKDVDVLESKYALDYLKHKLVAGLQHSIYSRLSASWNVGYFDRSGDYIDFVSKQKTAYKPYYLADVRFIWKTPAIDIYADIYNLTNQPQVDFGGLSLPGRNIVAGVKFRVM
ncbi:MAG TPA: TonB-dependent receptor [Paludibacteraceae bacterium]|nr:TonB-dependent receptor [Paludibacteraceae bacterium]